MHEEEEDDDDDDDDDDDNWMAALMDGCMDVFVFCFSGYAWLAWLKSPLESLGPSQQLWPWPGMALRAGEARRREVESGG